MLVLPTYLSFLCRADNPSLSLAVGFPARFAALCLSVSRWLPRVIVGEVSVDQIGDATASQVAYWCPMAGCCGPKLAAKSDNVSCSAHQFATELCVQLCIMIPEQATRFKWSFCRLKPG